LVSIPVAPSDVCLFEEDTGGTEVWKVSSTPDNPSHGIAAGVQEGAQRVNANGV
jgi:N-methylhydantoinase A